MAGRAPILLLLALLAGQPFLLACSRPLPQAEMARPAAQTPPPAHSPGQLFSLRLTDRDGPRFSGLLALRRGEGELYYSLLDGSGLKLLNGQVDREGRLLARGGPMAGTPLAGVVAAALSRSYLQQPASPPCSGWFPRLCGRPTESGWEKWATLGPLPLWRASGSVTGTAGDAATGGVHAGAIGGVNGGGNGGSGEAVESVEYSQPWLGLRLRLQPVAR